MASEIHTGSSVIERHSPTMATTVPPKLRLSRQSSEDQLCRVSVRQERGASQ